MVRLSAMLVVMGFTACRTEPKGPDDSSTPPGERPSEAFATPSVTPILSGHEMDKPEAPSTVSPDNIETHVARLVARLRGEGDSADLAAEAACFFEGVTWQGDDHVMRAEGEARSDGCVMKNGQDQPITYRATTAQISILFACEDGGLTQLIQDGSQLTQMNPTVPSCSGKRGVVFYQSKMSGEAEMPIDGGTRLVAFSSLAARGNDEKTPCHSHRQDNRVMIEDGCQDVSSFQAKYDEYQSIFYHRFQFHRVGGDAGSGDFDEGRVAAQVNDWDGEISFTPEGSWYNLKRGHEELHARLPGSL